MLVANKTIMVNVGSIDWDLLRKQKYELLMCAQNSRDPDRSLLDGLTGFIDCIQDQVALIIGEKAVFGRVDEDDERNPCDYEYVWVANIRHKQGNNHYVAKTEIGLRDKVWRFVNCYWEVVMDVPVMPQTGDGRVNKKLAIEQYFTHVEDEFLDQFGRVEL